MEVTPDELVLALATRQAGAFSRRQALALGVTDRMISLRLARKRWHKAHPGVYVVGGAPSDWSQDLWSAHLAIGPGAMVGLETSLLLRGLDDRHVPRHPLWFLVPRGSNHRVAGVVTRRVDDLVEHHATVIDGLRTCTPARAIVDLAAVVGPRRLGDLVDLVTDRLTTVARIAACASEVARRGKPGLGRLGTVLDERGPGYVPPQSELEHRLFHLLSVGGLPMPVRQFPLPGRGAVAGLVDAAYPHARLILEADGRRWHSRIHDLRRDHLRVTEAARVGWQTLRLLYEEIVESPGEVASSVGDVLKVRAAQIERQTG